MRRPMAAVGGSGHGLAWPAHGRLLGDDDHGRSLRDAAKAVRRRGPVDGDHARRRLASYRGHGGCRCFGVVPTVLKRRATMGDHVAVRLIRKKIAPRPMACRASVLADCQRLACG